MKTPYGMFNLNAELLRSSDVPDAGGDHTSQYTVAQTFKCRLRPGRRRGMGRDIEEGFGERTTYGVVMYCPPPSVVTIADNDKIKIVSTGELFNVEGSLDNARAEVYQTVMLRRVA